MELVRRGIWKGIKAFASTTFEALLSRAVEAKHDEKEENRTAPKKEERKLPTRVDTPETTAKCWHCPG